MASTVALDMACGGLSTAAVSALLNPSDVIKTRRQIVGLSGESPLAMARAVAASDGVLGLWRPGLEATVLREILYSGCTKGLYPYARDAVSGGRDSATLVDRALAASLTGFGGSLCANAVDVVKIKQFERPAAYPRGVLAAMRTIAADEGLVRGLLVRGVSASAPRGAAIAIGEITTYDATKDALKGTFPTRADGSEPFALHVVTSVVTGVVATTVAAPFDTIKSRVMAGGSGVNAASALGALLRSEGAGALLSGWWPAYCRLAPHAILTFPLLEQMRRVAGLENF
jgi:hypothetical protein